MDKSTLAPTQPAETANTSATQLAYQALRRMIVVGQLPPGEKLKIERLRQVFINVIRNAQKYCDADRPELHIKVARSDARLTIDFVDNGSGIARKSQEGIFDKFVRVNASKAGGAGLGLSICREVMTSLGGEITYLPGQGGAAFRVILPEAATPPAH